MVQLDIFQKITQLADYSAIKKLAAALWQQDASYHGAAIMIGAGFSRCASQCGDTSKKLPLWIDFSKKIAEELDPTNEKLPHSDPLRLAEEYRAYFGQQPLNDLIKKEINDAAWLPGTLYNSLLTLPWTEILTTNWDTLLERASYNINQPIYNIISKQSDLSSVRAPRIVKLHGTINTTEDLIFCQEDYRKYPETHAGFVNFARQVFIENELCLLGFSGDDPNFLQWAGWVRDHLSKNSRRIYLIGALNLTAAKRKYLESINISPIDLTELVSEFDNHDIRHIKATEYFFQALNNLKPKQPSEWSPIDLEKTNSTEEKISLLRKDRSLYPDWLVCPHNLRWKIKSQISVHQFNKKSISQLSTVNRAQLLYEIAWRYRIIFEAIPQWLGDEFIKICDPITDCGLNKKQQMEIALLLLKNTRWLEKSSEKSSIEDKTASILIDNTQHWPECETELAFHQAIVARDDLNYTKMEEVVDNIIGIDPFWKIKKSFILAELGRFTEGNDLILSAYNELLEHFRRDRNSIHILSRLSWAHTLLRGIQSWDTEKKLDALPPIHKNWKCDPWEEIEHLKERVSKDVEEHYKQQNSIEPLFEPGHYKDNSNKIIFNSDTHLFLLLDGITQNTGMPLRWNNTSFLTAPAEKIISLDCLDEPETFKFSIRTATTSSSASINNTFSRIKLACASQTEVLEALNYCNRAIDYWREKLTLGTATHRNYCIDRLGVFIEVFARLLIRSTPERAKNAFKLGIEIGNEKFSSYPRLHDPLKSLFKYSLNSIPKSLHSELLLDALRFPLSSETNITAWPNPIIDQPGLRQPNLSLDLRISELIEAINPTMSTCSLFKTNSEERAVKVEISEGNNKKQKLNTQAISRLLPLISNSFTTPLENSKLSDAIYRNNSNHTNLPHSDFFPHVFSILPSNDKERTLSLISKTLFPEICLFEPDKLQAIISASKNTKNTITPTQRQSISYFDQLVAWRNKKDQNDSVNLFEQTDAQQGKLIGEVLAYCVAPNLPLEALTKVRFEQLHAFWSEVDAPAAAMALVYFIKTNENLSESIEKPIRKSLQDRRQNNVSFAAFAILKWRELSDEETPKKLISKLIYLIESGRTIGLASLLWTINEAFINKWLSNDDLRKV